MAAVFHDHPEALANTLRIAERCNVDDPEGPEPPAELRRARRASRSTTTSSTSRARASRSGCRACAQLAAAGTLRHTIDEYERRLDVRDRDDQEDGVPGLLPDRLGLHPLRARAGHPGRARAAARRPVSFVAYCLRITDVDPIDYDLLFERFLNPERISLPDIDVDFCERRRGEVIDYVTRKYGRENVAQIITFGTMKAQGGRARRRPRARHAVRRRRQASPSRSRRRST